MKKNTNEPIYLFYGRVKLKQIKRTVVSSAQKAGWPSGLTNGPGDFMLKFNYLLKREEGGSGLGREGGKAISSSSSTSHTERCI